MTDQNKHVVPNADTHNQGEGKPGGGKPGLANQGAGSTKGDNRRAGDVDGNRGAEAGRNEDVSVNPSDRKPR